MKKKIHSGKGGTNCYICAVCEGPLEDGTDSVLCQKCIDKRHQKSQRSVERFGHDDPLDEQPDFGTEAWLGKLMKGETK